MLKIFKLKLRHKYGDFKIQTTASSIESAINKNCDKLLNQIFERIELLGGESLHWV